MSIAIINSSTVVSDADGKIIVDALNLVLPRFCLDWSLPTYVASYVGLGKTTTIRTKVYILDTSDVQGALGYHDTTSDIPYGKCFAKTTLTYGGGVLMSPSKKATVSQCIAHEVFELLIDPVCNGWWDVGDGKTLFAREVCDPVEDNDLIVSVVTKPAVIPPNPWGKQNIGTPAVTAQVTLSDWILPAWSDPQNTRGPFNYMGTLKRPFSLDKGGYGIKLTVGDVGIVTAMSFGTEVTDEKKEQYLAKGRVTRRMT